MHNAETDGTEQNRSGPRGERNRLLIWVGIAFFLPSLFILALRLPVRPSVIGVPTELPAQTIQAFFVLLATALVCRIEGRAPGDYGLSPGRACGCRLWEGLVWGFGMLSAVVLVLYLLGDFKIDAVALTTGAALKYGLGWALTFLLLGIHEEFAFRGYLLFCFARRMHFWRAAILLSFVFAASHLANSGENALGIVQNFVIGIVFCLTIRRTGNLWFAVGFHATWDWAQTFFYGTPDSGLLGTGRLLQTSAQGAHWLTGGSAGPEGSVVAILLLALCALLLHFRFPSAVYPDCPV